MQDTSPMRLLSRVGGIPGVVYFECDLPLSSQAIPDDLFETLGVGPFTADSLEAYVERVVLAVDRGRVVAHLRRLFEHGEAYDLRFRIRREDGRERLLQSIAEPVHAADGSVCKAIFVVVDVTALLSEGEAEHRGHLYTFAQRMLGAVPAGLLVLDPQQRIVFANERMTAGLGRTDLEGLGLEEVAGGVLSSAKMDEAMRTLTASDEPLDPPYVMWTEQVAYEGEDHQIEFFTARIDGPHELIRSGAVLLSMTDVTEQHRARDVLANHAEELEAQVQARTQALQRANEQLTARAREQRALAELGAKVLRGSWDDAVEAAFEAIERAGQSRFVSVVIPRPNEDVAARYLRGMGAPIDVPLASIPATDAKTTTIVCPEPWRPGVPEEIGGVRVFRLRAVDEDLGLLVVHMSSGDMLRGDEEIFLASVAHVLSEVRAREVAMMQLRHADRLAAVGRLTAGIAHQLGTPLNVISAHAGLIARDKVRGDDVLQSARAIEDQVERVSLQVRAVLDYARGGQEPTAKVDVRNVARRTIAVLEPVAVRRKIKLSLELAQEPCWSVLAAQSLQQIITNLVDNGMDAQPEGGAVRISVERGEGLVRIQVEEDGDGIPPAVQARIFESFFTTKPPGRGTGLGLPVVRGLVREAGGSLEFSSRASQGTTFVVTVPSTDIPA